MIFSSEFEEVVSGKTIPADHFPVSGLGALSLARARLVVLAVADPAGG